MKKKKRSKLSKKLAESSKKKSMEQTLSPGLDGFNDAILGQLSQIGIEIFKEEGSGEIGPGCLEAEFTAGEKKRFRLHDGQPGAAWSEDAKSAEHGLK